jgi:uncharacterized protein YqfA (UPF0365 family)
VILRLAELIEQDLEGFAVAESRDNGKPIHLARKVDIPRAVAEAFRSGNLGVMDYERLKNLQADTGMRQSLGKP